MRIKKQNNSAAPKTVTADNEANKKRLKAYADRMAKLSKKQKN